MVGRNRFNPFRIQRQPQDDAIEEALGLGSDRPMLLTHRSRPHVRPIYEPGMRMFNNPFRSDDPAKDFFNTDFSSIESLFAKPKNVKSKNPVPILDDDEDEDI